MIALVRCGTDVAPLAIHRTFLARDGHGKAPVEPQKMMLGSCRGGCATQRRSPTCQWRGEDIETCFAAMQAAGFPGWAALSTSGPRPLEPPNELHEVIVLADGGEPSEAAAGAAGLRWLREGRPVRVSPARRGRWISMTCFWAARPCSRARHDRRDFEPERRGHQRRRGNPRSA
ncbi:MAG: hypothetical protein WCB09_06650 [Methylocella sp.]